MVKIELTFKEEDLALFRLSPQEFVKELRLAAAAKWYEEGLISQEKAAEISGLSREEFLKSLGKFRVSPFQVTAEELEEESRECSN